MNRDVNRIVWILSTAALLLAGAIANAQASRLRGADSCPFTCGDIDGDGHVDSGDFASFAGCMGEDASTSPACRCADMDGSEVVDLADFAIYARLFGLFSIESPPQCTGAIFNSGDLTAYRPQHGVGYLPFVRTAVPDSDEEDVPLGPGIRIQQAGETDPAGEDDLIEVTIAVDPPGSAVALRRDSSSLLAWSTRTRTAGSEIVFTDDKTAALPIGPGDSQLTVWIEWASPSHGTAALSLEPVHADISIDALVFHTFNSIVIALGGEGQVPTDPADPNAGTFVIAVGLYVTGYDVHMYDEDAVSADGSGVVFDEVVNAIQHRAVSQVAIYGYSHGGGSTYSLADRLDAQRAMIGDFTIGFTSYVDSVRNNSDLDVAMELRRPPASSFHVNHYQHGSLFEDFLLDGGPVPDSDPPPTGLDVETTAWGAGATHFEIDDFLEVRDWIEMRLLPRVDR